MNSNVQIIVIIIIITIIIITYSTVVNLSAKAVINGENNANVSTEACRQLQQIQIKISS